MMQSSLKRKRGDEPSSSTAPKRRKHGALKEGDALGIRKEKQRKEKKKKKRKGRGTMQEAEQATHRSWKASGRRVTRRRGVRSRMDTVREGTSSIVTQLRTQRRGRLQD